MKVVIKDPDKKMRIAEVKDLQEINKIVNNVDENGEGNSRAGSDIRKEVFHGIDMYMNENAVFSDSLKNNFWDKKGNALYCGSVVFAGYDPDCGAPYGVCSLTDDQIQYLFENIGKYYDIIC